MLMMTSVPHPVTTNTPAGGTVEAISQSHSGLRVKALECDIRMILSRMSSKAAIGLVPDISDEDRLLVALGIDFKDLTICRFCFYAMVCREGW